MKRRECQRCGRNRAEKFYTGPKGRICSFCRRSRVRSSSKGVRLQETYDVTLDEWEAILAAQGGVCAICQGKRTTYDTDHDHQLAKTHGVRASLRGVICKRCNRRLLPGCVDNVEILKRAIAYLTNPPAQEVLRETP